LCNFLFYTSTDQHFCIWYLPSYVRGGFICQFLFADLSLPLAFIGAENHGFDNSWKSLFANLRRDCVFCTPFLSWFFLLFFHFGFIHWRFFLRGFLNPSSGFFPPPTVLRTPECCALFFLYQHDGLCALCLIGILPFPLTSFSKYPIHPFSYFGIPLSVAGFDGSFCFPPQPRRRAVRFCVPSRAVRSAR